MRISFSGTETQAAFHAPVSFSNDQQRRKTQRSTERSALRADFFFCLLFCHFNPLLRENGFLFHSAAIQHVMDCDVLTAGGVPLCASQTQTSSLKLHRTLRSCVWMKASLHSFHLLLSFKSETRWRSAVWNAALLYNFKSFLLLFF